MSEISPQIIYNENPNTPEWAHSYRWFDGGQPGYEFYGLYYSSGITNGGTQLSIKVNTTTNVWEDGNLTQNPTSVTTDGTIVTCVFPPDSADRRFIFTKPTLASWIPVEPATGTEGSTSDCHLTYDPVQNWMQAFLNATLDSTDLVSTRNLYYRVRNATTNNVSADFNMNHTSGTHTYLNFYPTVNGTYELQKVLTNPLEVLICDSAVVNTFPASDDPPENDPPPTPVSVPRSARRGNLNFW